MPFIVGEIPIDDEKNMLPASIPYSLWLVKSHRWWNLDFHRLNPTEKPTTSRVPHVNPRPKSHRSSPMTVDKRWAIRTTEQLPWTEWTKSSRACCTFPSFSASWFLRWDFAIFSTYIGVIWGISPIMGIFMANHNMVYGCLWSSIPWSSRSSITWWGKMYMVMGTITNRKWHRGWLNLWCLYT